MKRKSVKRKLKIDDPFSVKLKIPKGMTYQWVTISVLGDMELSDYVKMTKAKWKPVPSRRHPEMPSAKGKIVYGGQLLMERKKSLSDQSRNKEMEAARKASSMEGGMQGTCRSRDDITPDQGWLQRFDEVSKEAEINNYTFYVTVGIELNKKEIEAAAILNLTAQEYARRKVAMIDQLVFSQADTTILRSKGNNIFSFDTIGILHQGQPQ